MCKRLPERINVERLAKEHTRLAGTIPPTAMPRLQEAVIAVASDATVELAFANSLDGYPAISGEVAVPVELTCQRCLCSMDWPLASQLALALTHNDDAANTLPSRYEPLLWPDGVGSLSELVEEELLLALPVVAKHADPAHCGRRVAHAMQHNVIEEQVRNDNPFAVLNQLKNRRRDP